MIPLSPDELRAWRSYTSASTLLQDAVDRRVQADAGMPHLYYSILATLSEAPERRLRMIDLAATLKITRSRLTHAVARLEKDGTVRRESYPTDRRGHKVVLTDEGMSLVERIAPGHVATVRAAVFDRLTAEQVGQLEEICDAITLAIQGSDPAAGGEDLPWQRRTRST
ncbi:MarR family winged helix-turn-helix transcriptional regulator [Streptomyces sp. NPDC001914]|uniref:MarR family winged helix-turn-helix transcriptional regulator n=1 Tax=Streptomyces sp. NPDC001914 TaxID=3364623 RepID=UPI00369BC919